MPSAKTYQAIGFATYHGAKLKAKSKLGRAPLPPPKKRGPDRKVLIGAGVALALLALLGVAKQRSSAMPTV